MVASSKKKQKKKQAAKKGAGKKPRDELRLAEPTPEEIAEYASRPRKRLPKAAETSSQKEAKAALDELLQYSTEPFFLDVRLIKQPQGVTCSRNKYPGHIEHLVKEIHIRGSLFPCKTIYVALGNVSDSFSLLVISGH